MKGKRSKLKCICMVLLVAAFSAPAAKASPITYDVVFVTSSGPSPLGAEFTYDSNTQSFSYFEAWWRGYTFDLASSANSPVIIGDPCGGLSGGAATFALLSNTCTLDQPDWFGHISPSPEFGFNLISDGVPDRVTIAGFSGPVIPPYDIAGGTWTIEVDPDGPDGPDPEPDPPAPTPEPGTLVMFGSGIVGLAGMLRRKTNP